MAADSVVRRRPAESLAIASAFALLLGRALGIDDADTITAIAVVIGFIPSAVSWVVDRFGDRFGWRRV